MCVCVCVCVCNAIFSVNRHLRMNSNVNFQINSLYFPKKDIYHTTQDQGMKYSTYYACILNI